MMVNDHPVIRFEVPGAPKGVARPRTRVVVPKGGKPFATIYKDATTRAEGDLIRVFALIAMKGKPPIEGPVELRCSAYFQIPESWSKKKRVAAGAGEIYPTVKPDFDNIVKFVGDAMNGVVLRDDSQIVSAHIWKRYCPDNRPRLVMEIRQVK
jgi:Holliday junction resolvase RusA-like endonuclease